MYERLESRQLLAAAPAVIYQDTDSQHIHIRGTQGDDAISVVRRGDRILVQLNDRRRWFDRSTVRGVEIDARGGNDLIDARHVALRVAAYGQAGFDTILGGWGDDQLRGGDNGDRILGNAGADDLSGGVGRDRLIGGADNDTLSGDNGDDFCSGNGGDDDFTAVTGDDTLDGGAGGDLARYFPGRGQLASVESLAFYATAQGDDDRHVDLGAVTDADGVVTVGVLVTTGSGYNATLNPTLKRVGNTFTVTLTGTQQSGGLTGQDSYSVQGIITNVEPYKLGKLADGTYTFHVNGDVRRVATLTIQVEGGKLINVPKFVTPIFSTGEW